MRIEVVRPPPFLFVTGAVDLAVVRTAKRHGKFVAHFAPERPGLREPNMMRIRRLPPADQASLRSNEFQMRFIAPPPRFAEGENAFVDATTMAAV